MTSDKKLGSAVPGATTKNFGDASGQWATLSGQLTLLGTKLSELQTTPPLSPTQIHASEDVLKTKATLDDWGAKMNSFVGFKRTAEAQSTKASGEHNAAALIETATPYLDSQGRMTREAQIRYLADTANGTGGLSASGGAMPAPSPELVKQASDMVAKLGIKDDDHSVATGLARIATGGSVVAKMIVDSGVKDPVAGEKAEEDILGKGLQQAMQTPGFVSPKPAGPKS